MHSISEASIEEELGSVVQSFVSLTSSFVVKMLTVLVSTISNSQVQYNLDGSDTDGSFTVDDSNSFLSP